MPSLWPPLARSPQSSTGKQPHLMKTECGVARGMTRLHAKLVTFLNLAKVAYILHRRATSSDKTECVAKGMTRLHAKLVALFDHPAKLAEVLHGHAAGAAILLIGLVHEGCGRPQAAVGEVLEAAPEHPSRGMSEAVVVNEAPELLPDCPNHVSAAPASRTGRASSGLVGELCTNFEAAYTCLIIAVLCCTV